MRPSLLASFECSVNDVFYSLKLEDDDAPALRVNNPVFGNASLGIFAPLGDQVAVAVFALFAQNFHHEICPGPELLARHGVVLLCDEEKVWFAKLPCAQPKSQRG